MSFRIAVAKNVIPRFIVAASAALISCSVADNAQAQLRSGGTTRAIYQPPQAVVQASHTEADHSTNPAPSIASSNKKKVVRASAAEPAKPARNAKAAKTTTSPAKDNAVVQASCAHCDGEHATAEHAEVIAGDIIMESPEIGDLGCDSCGDTCGGSCGDSAPCGHPGCGWICYRFGHGPIGTLLSRAYVRAEVTRWDRTGMDMPALVTTSVPTTTPAADAGQLGLATTRTLFGGIPLNDGIQGGGRLTLGTWLDPAKDCGLVLRVWDAGDASTAYASNNSANAILARPFFNVTNGQVAQQDAQLIAYPNSTEGSVNALVDSSFVGGDIVFRRWLCASDTHRWDLLAGYETLRLEEGLTVQSFSRVTTAGNLLPVGATINVQDSFNVRNTFHGGQLGIQGAKRWGCWYFEGLFKLGIGSVERAVTINGQTTTVSGGLVANDPQGLLARFPNSGQFKSNAFAVVPEFGLNLGYRLTNTIDLTVGYTYLGLPKVQQVATTLDPQLASNLADPLAGQLRPTYVVTESNYWLSGLNFGAQWRY